MTITSSQTGGFTSAPFLLRPRSRFVQSAVRALESAPARGEGRRIEHRREGQRQHDRKDFKKTLLKPHRNRQWVIPPDANAGFVAAMEDVLEAYQRPRDPDRPLVCLDLLLTGARRSEITLAKWEHVDWTKQALLVPVSKSGKPRAIALNTAALTLLKSIPRDPACPYVFPTRQIVEANVVEISMTADAVPGIEQATEALARRLRAPDVAGLTAVSPLWSRPAGFVRGGQPPRRWSYRRQRPDPLRSSPRT